MTHPSGTCSLCEKEISRHALMEHLESCLAKRGWQEVDDPSLVIHISPKMDSRYYLVVIAHPDATFHALDEFLKSTVGVDEDRSSRFQFKDQMYFSHMNDGFPGMNFPLHSSPLMHEKFTYLIYTQGWFPVIMEGKMMGRINRVSPGNTPITLVADSNIPEEYHQWPQRPK